MIPQKVLCDLMINPGKTVHPLRYLIIRIWNQKLAEQAAEFQKTSATRATSSYLLPRNGCDNRSRSRFRLAHNLGFSAAFLGGLFKSGPDEEEMTDEDKTLLEIKRAIFAIRNGNISIAEAHLAKSWKMSVDFNLEKAKTQILDIQANLHFHKGELDKAEKLFKTVTQRLVNDQGMAANDNAIIEISMKLAQMYAMKGMYAESISGFEYCVDCQKQKIEKDGAEDEDTLMLGAWAMHSLAQVYLSRNTSRSGDSKSAIEDATRLIKDAHAIVVRAVGPDCQQALAIATDLAAVMALTGDVDGALLQLQECEKLAGEKNEQMKANIKVNAGSLHLQKGNLDEAHRVCVEAQVIAGKYQDFQAATSADECLKKVAHGRKKLLENIQGAPAMNAA